ncbi:MAG: hypothetical protein WCC60_10170, partial [Ilumatobacteraceae bacterium]
MNSTRTSTRTTRLAHVGRVLAAAACAATAFGLLTPTTHAGNAAPTPELLVQANGCDFTFTTINGQGVNDAWSATFSVDGNDAGGWSSSDDLVTLTNWISRDFTPGGTLTVTWTILALPGETTLNSGTAVLTVPPCELPYQLRVDKVVTGQAPAGAFTVKVWNGDNDGGVACSDTPPTDAQSVQLPATGGSATVRVSPGKWCVAETERQGALTTTYASANGAALGLWHVATVPPAPGILPVTITNAFAPPPTTTTTTTPP